MAPSTTTGSTSRTALVSKPVAPRYRRGKLPSGLEPSFGNDDDDDSDQDDEEVEDEEAKRRESRSGVTMMGPGKIIQIGDGDRSGSAPTAKGRTGEVKKLGIQVALRDVKVESGGRVVIGGRTTGSESSSGEEESDEDDEEEEEEDVKPRFIPRSSGLGKHVNTASARAPGQEHSDESGTESSSGEEESSEEEEKPMKPVYRPTFVPKRARETVLVREADRVAQEEAWKKKEEELETRKKESRNLLGDSIKREMAEREAEDIVPDVDDTDGLDPTAEFDDWRLRELARLTREKETALAREEERKEIERRREMPEHVRLAEDEEYARRTREQNPKEKRGFLEKYYHKGAFHQDEDIVKRTIAAPTESAVDMQMLPKIMQVRDFGKRSRTKYTHLKDQDTTGDGWNRALRTGSNGRPSQQEGCFNCGGPHLRRDCPNNDVRGEAGGSRSRSSDLPAGTGSNSATLGAGSLRDSGQRRDDGEGYDRNRKHSYGDREDRRPDDNRGLTHREHGRDRTRDNDRTRSRSRSPARDRRGYYRD